VAATPIGNLGDLSPRAAEVLAKASLILAEDTRRAGLLLQSAGVRAQRMASLFEHNEEGRIKQALEVLGAGEDVALISDAGSPLLSDPGYRLVRACREAGLAVKPVPGPSAVTAALSACGLPPYPFTFLGFPPRNRGKLSKLLESHKNTGATLVLFERKDRVSETLAVALEALGDREACLAREMTKEHEEFILGSLAELAGRDLSLRGEITIVIGPGQAVLATDEDTAIHVLREERQAGGKPKEVAKRAAERLSGWSAKELYELLNRSGEGENPF
jgi:16S rRNA (cytidine1402-2'-O)-methyltransferase